MNWLFPGRNRRQRQEEREQDSRQHLADDKRMRERKHEVLSKMDRTDQLIHDFVDFDRLRQEMRDGGRHR